MLKARVHTALLLVIGFFAVLFLSSNDVWAFLTLLVTMIALWEWAKLIALTPLQTKSFILVGLIAGFLLNATRGYFAHDLVMTGLLGFSVLFWLVMAPIWLGHLKKFNHRFWMAMLGLCLMLAMWLGLIALHLKGPLAVILLLATVWLADSAAYFAGKKFGKRKLAPNISPGKTWEGVFGALVAVTLYGFFIHFVFSVHLAVLGFLWLIVVLSIVGDLFESLLKRQANMKDSSQLLPGHGGVLDRIDGLLPTISFAGFALLMLQYFHL